MSTTRVVTISGDAAGMSVASHAKRRSPGLEIHGEAGKIIRNLCRQKEVELIEEHAIPDHIHLVLSVPQLLSVTMVLGYLKGKSAIHIHPKVHGIKQGFTGRRFWSCGYCVSTIGLDEK